MIEIDQMDHAGIRIKDEAAALKFYGALGFEVMTRVEFDAVIVIKNKNDVELNLVCNGVDNTDGKNILMDVPEKHTGITHLALRVTDIKATIAALADNDITITQGPVTFGKDGHVSVFVRDPDRNVIELRGRMQDEDSIEGLEFYDPEG
ncbi:MAG: VOC family protein [Rhodospirillaceae bacterium]|jgi:lactoylglutathione lyase|nr:VOC family protein [Rhodospirillaceae bacterium]MBT3887547.1 VOC family protein [Rhodospirillaceae bacterium]MBT4674194.1 VOC family protein [Rhodospirillaceae bacterium]MBT4718306.1 VOC family protein [Rhodospirillaceae bacterium]MBT4751707.1 VOC family protein [Rhodospirillaceae bacterium]